MAKVSLTKLGLKVNQDIKTIKFNEQIVEVKQYLPVNIKLELISNVINRILLENNNFINPIKIEVFTVIEMLYCYTNINFTEKQKEDIPKLYDLVVSSELWERIIEAIPEEEFDFVVEGVIKSIKEIYKYKNSAMGILENISTDYSNLDLEATEIQNKLNDPENMAFLKDVLTKLG